MLCEICEREIYTKPDINVNKCYECYNAKLIIDNGGVCAYEKQRYGYVVYKTENDVEKQNLSNVFFYEINGEDKHAFSIPGFVCLHEKFIEYYQPNFVRIIDNNTQEYNERLTAFKETIDERNLLVLRQRNDQESPPVSKL